jgi:hypothetical protein
MSHALVTLLFAFILFVVVRIKKGSRVYAMYPQTTSLYSATVIDSTTYCRDDDDIIVVEFDGEELGRLPPRLEKSSESLELTLCSPLFTP